MAIVGFLIHTLPDQAQGVERQSAAITGISTYGIHKECYIVAVAEGSSKTIEDIFNQVHALEGVLTTYVTSLTREDETPELPGLTTGQGDPCSGPRSS